MRWLSTSCGSQRPMRRTRGPPRSHASATWRRRARTTPPTNGMVINAAHTSSTLTAHAGTDSVPRNASDSARKVAIANMRSVRVTPRIVGNAACAPRRRSSTNST